MKYFDEFDFYIEKLLILQFTASEIIKHNLTKGEVREDFVKEQVGKQFEDILYHKGFICCDDSEYQSSQLDIIVTKKDARSRNYGGHSLIEIEDAKMVIEVKSSAKTNDLRKLDALAEKLKDLKKDANIKVGLFCYSYELKEKNLLKKFGYKYDEDIDSYNFDKSINREFNNIDFVLALDKDKEYSEENKDFFIIKDTYSNSFVLYKDEPVSKYFFRLFKKI